MRKITYTEMHCADCKFHKSKLFRHVRIGENTYQHFCQHPTVGSESFLMGETGRYIGSKDIVPQWCPLLPQVTPQGEGE